MYYACYGAGLFWWAGERWAGPLGFVHGGACVGNKRGSLREGVSVARKTRTNRQGWALKAVWLEKSL